MGKHLALALVLFLLIPCAVCLGSDDKSWKIITLARYSAWELADQWCSGIAHDENGECNKCMHQAHGLGYWTGDDTRCNAPVGTLLGHLISQRLGFDVEWIDVFYLLAGEDHIMQAVDYCEQDWYNDDHAATGTPCAGEDRTIRGAYQIGAEYDLGNLAPYIDPNIGPPDPYAPPNYAFVLDFSELEYALYLMNTTLQDEWWYVASPWKKAFAASCFWYQDTGSQIALWSMAHALVCWQSCEGWECGSVDDVDVFPSGFPEWPYDWEQQPTFLFYLYFAIHDEIGNIAVANEDRSWGAVKDIYR